jgi:seryl-tRNA synthetase
MIDIGLLREKPDFVKEALSTKKFECDIDRLLELDSKRRARLQVVEQKRAQQKQSSQAMTTVIKASMDYQLLLESLKALSEELKILETELNQIESEWEALCLTIPNLPDASVPVGKSDKDNVVISSWGDIEAISAHAIPHYDIPWFSKAIDFGRGVKVTGAGFPFYVGDMARLVRALISFYLEEARKNGYQEFMTPIVVNQASATATGQLPDKEGMMYADIKEDLYLIPTAELPITNFLKDEILEESVLPIYACAHTPCFRREAGSWGKEVRGLNRLHQFDKVELVKWVEGSQSFIELEKLRGDAERLLQQLELPYRVVSICSKDLGFTHAKQYDLEVWAGGQKRWLEVSSCSNFTDFQARRANIRYRPKDGGKPKIVHTLNGSGLPIPRVLAAILENNYQADGSVKIPAVLKRWFDAEFINF